MLGSDLGQDIANPEVLHGFPLSLQASAGMKHLLEYDCFLPDPFQFSFNLNSTV
jgi:hypothetical protein